MANSFYNRVVEVYVMRKMPYEETFIYVMLFGTTWQGLFAIENEIFESHYQGKPQFLRWVGWKLGIIKALYTKNETAEYEKVIMNWAMDSVAAVKEKKRKEANELRKSHKTGRVIH